MNKELKKQLENDFGYIGGLWVDPIIYSKEFLTFLSNRGQEEVKEILEIIPTPFHPVLTQTLAFIKFGQELETVLHLDDRDLLKEIEEEESN